MGSISSGKVICGRLKLMSSSYENSSLARKTGKGMSKEGKEKVLSVPAILPAQQTMAEKERNGEREKIAGES